jgi:hypothetical protein
MSTVKAAIEQSVKTNSIVHIEYTVDAYDELVAMAEDWVTADEYTVDAWGCDKNGDWRVILDRPSGSWS